MRTNSIDFKTENLPYLYHSEYCDVAWTHSFGGFFIDANGIKYEYKNPDNWKTLSGNSDLVKAEDLISNLRVCKVKKPWFGIKPKHLSQEIIDELLKSELTDYGLQMHDAGTTTNSLFVYDKANEHYKQVILSVYGNNKCLNSSIYAQQLIAEFGEYTYKHR